MTPTPRLDPEAERELSQFVSSGSNGSSPDMRRLADARALRCLLRESVRRGGPGRPTTLLRAEEFCAEILRRPSRSGPVADRWWNALRAFAESMRSSDPQLLLSIDAIEERLVPRDNRKWYVIKRIAGGERGPRRRPRLLLFTSDLLAATQRAQDGRRGEHALRDWAYVAMNCWSPLRAGEIERLSWEQVEFVQASQATFGARITVPRPGRTWTLPIHARASEPLGLLFAVQHATDREPSGRVFRSLRPPYAPLSYEQGWRIVRTSLDGIRPGATRQDLLAAYAYYLKTIHQFTIPDLREILGYSQVIHAHSLLGTHIAWELRQKATAAAELEGHGAEDESRPGD